ncbi:MAG: hypothetical protein J0H40_17700 [Rhizobiales bacterium]|nr:hypothetical protein [Hyphomicrobiales bacterium]
MVVLYPKDMLIEADHDWNIVGNTTTAGISTGASEDTRSDGGGFWSASLNNIEFLHRNDTLVWRAIRQQCNGGVVPIIVCRRDIEWIPLPAGQSLISNIPHSDGSLFDDGSGYTQSVIDVVTSGAAPLRATSLVLKQLNCADLQGGESFSIQHESFGWRLYEIGSVDKIDDLFTSVTFNPPLREAVPDGTQVEFDAPRCTMKLVDSSSMDLNIKSFPFSLATVKFVESKYK